MSKIKFNSVGYMYQSYRPVLTNFNLTAGPGDLTVLHGPNGSGKTTILSLGAGWLQPKTGSIERAGKVAYLPTRIEFHNNLTVHEELRYLAAAGSIPLAKLTASAEVWGFGTASIKQEIATLSTGWRQRLALAIAACSDGTSAGCIMLLDEPFANLDEEGRTAGLRWVTRLLDRGSVVLLASHDSDTALSALNPKVVNLGMKNT